MFLEANAKGYWDTDEDNIEKLKQVGTHIYVYVK